MTVTLDVEIFDDVFHGCALAAYIEVAQAMGGPPDSETTRRLAYRMFEQALAEKQGRSIACTNAQDVAA